MTSLRSLARTVLAGALACALSACWMSAKPLITDREAAEVGFAGAYRGEGDDGPVDAIFVSTGGTHYEMTNGKQDRLAVRFMLLQRDWYLMQVESHSDEEGTDNFYLYQLVTPVNDDLQVYAPDCGDVPGKFNGLKRENTLGEVAEGDTAPLTCNFSTLNGLKELATVAIAKIEKGELDEEPAILKRVKP